MSSPCSNVASKECGLFWVFCVPVYKLNYIINIYRDLSLTNKICSTIPQLTCSWRDESLFHLCRRCEGPWLCLWVAADGFPPLWLCQHPYVTIHISLTWDVSTASSGEPSSPLLFESLSLPVFVFLRRDPLFAAFLVVGGFGIDLLASSSEVMICLRFIC